jgi:hypothetical protein
MFEYHKCFLLANNDKNSDPIKDSNGVDLSMILFFFGLVVLVLKS